jgi:phosphoglycerate dehydrogenase-like enzyme
MPESSALVIAHQLPPAAADEIAARLPGGVRLEAVDPAEPWPTDAEVLVGGPVGVRAGKVARPPGWPGRLRWLHLRSAGIDEFPDWILEAPLLTVTRGAQAAPIAEFVLAAMLAHEKRLPAMWIHAAADWRQCPLGTLEGRTLGLVGFGHIGQAVARRALAFDMRLVAHYRGDPPAGFAAVARVPLEALLATADHLVIAAPLTAETRGLLGAEAFARMRPGVHIVNIARGAVIDQAALRAALDAGVVGAASLDVTDPEPPPAGHWLYTHPRVRLSPHVAFSAPATSLRAAAIFLDNLRCFLDGRPNLMGGHVDRVGRY